MDLSTLSDRPFLDDSSGLPLDRPFSYAQARGLGLSPNQLTGLVSQGFLRRPLRGVYVAAQLGDSIAVRAQCLSLVVPDDCVVGGRHAGWLLGSDMVLAPNEHLAAQPITVYRPSGHGRLRNPMADSGERVLRDRDITEVYGLPVTTPLRTTCDLGRVRSREQALAGIDAMRHVHPLSIEELLAEAARFRGHRWITMLRAMIPISDGRAASFGESVLRLRWLDASLPPPDLQIPVRSNGVLLGILDLGNERMRFAAEYDGAEWHDSPEQRAHDEVRRAAIRDEDWVVLALRQHNVFGHHQDAHQLLRAGAKEARLRFGRRTGA